MSNLAVVEFLRGDLNPGERHSRVTWDDGTVTLCALRAATVLSRNCCADLEIQACPRRRLVRRRLVLGDRVHDSASFSHPEPMCIQTVSSRWCLENMAGECLGLPPQRAPKQYPLNGVWRMLWESASRHGLLDTVKTHMESGDALKSHTNVGSQHPSPNVKNPLRIRAANWLEIITSRDAKSACFQGSQTSCAEVISGIFWPKFGPITSHVMDGCFLLMFKSLAGWRFDIASDSGVWVSGNGLLASSC